MAIVGITSKTGIVNIYQIILSLIICTPSLSLIYKLLDDDKFSQCKKRFLIISLLVAIILILISKDSVLIGLFISTLVIGYYKKYNSDKNPYKKIWLNTLISINLLIGILYSLQLYLKPTLTTSNSNSITENSIINKATTE